VPRHLVETHLADAVLTRKSIDSHNVSTRCLSAKWFKNKAPFTTASLASVSLGLKERRDKPGNAKGESITVPLTSCLTDLDLSVLQIKTKIVICQSSQTGGQMYSDTSPFRIPWTNTLAQSESTSVTSEKKSSNDDQLDPDGRAQLPGGEEDRVRKLWRVEARQEPVHQRARGHQA